MEQPPLRIQKTILISLLKINFTNLKGQKTVTLFDTNNNKTQVSKACIVSLSPLFRSTATSVTQEPRVSCSHLCSLPMKQCVSVRMHMYASLFRKTKMKECKLYVDNLRDSLIYNRDMIEQTFYSTVETRSRVGAITECNKPV